MPNVGGDAAVTVTLAEIARIAGVGRAAVSNWRRRHPDFPAPTGGSDTSPQFSLDEVEAWLREHGRLPGTTGAAQRLWPRFEALGERDVMARILAAVGNELSGRRPGPDPQGELNEAELALLRDARALAKREGSDATFAYLFDRWLGTHVRQVSATPPLLAELMCEIAELGGAGKVETVLDPACGTGSLLLAAARRWAHGSRPSLLGQELDPALAALAAARVGVHTNVEARIEASDTLRRDAFEDVRADVVLCNVPSNQRDWGYDELSADPRWVWGLPPRTESELAWVQHAASVLADAGIAVLALPPSVAARRAGRRIRAGLLRSGALRAVVALPVGSAPPYAIAPHLWVLGAPDRRGDAAVLMVDASDCRVRPSTGRPGVDWAAVALRVRHAWDDAETAERTRRVPVIELLDEDVDLSPARHLPLDAEEYAAGLRANWSELTDRLRRADELRRTLSGLAADPDAAPIAKVTIGELERVGALRVQASGTVPSDRVGVGPAPANAVPVLTPEGLAAGDAPQWIAPPEDGKDDLLLARRGDVIVVGTTRAFDARVHTDEPAALSSLLLVLRVDPDRIDPWFLAGCLRAPGNARRAGGHASTSSRVDPRRLSVPRLPISEQRRLGAVFQQLADLNATLDHLCRTGAALEATVGALAAEGRLDAR
ncbi:N-6 DNA methylase [Actinomadura gamaensis]|uniref:N-6 DNA methylase n=1 Tax=Actinomadura gamaensis TaxID=1763541 RepID=A0ABV9U0F0_9ACTN